MGNTNVNYHTLVYDDFWIAVTGWEISICCGDCNVRKIWCIGVRKICRIPTFKQIKKIKFKWVHSLQTVLIFINFLLAEKCREDEFRMNRTTLPDRGHSWKRVSCPPGTLSCPPPRSWGFWWSTPGWPPRLRSREWTRFREVQSSAARCLCPTWCKIIWKPDSKSLRFDAYVFTSLGS